MSNNYLILKNVSFSYSSMTVPLLSNINVAFNKGWTGIIGANGTGKTTLLKLATGEIQPEKGRVIGSENAAYCRQRTDDAPAALRELLCSTDSTACRITGELNIGPDWHNRWNTLSHGERKRAQIAVAMWSRPAILAVDEPTNHLDAEAHDHLFQTLSVFTGIGLLVSHDRKLLDSLCRQCLFIDPPEVVLRPGNYTQGSCQDRNEKEALRNLRKTKKQALVKLKKEAAKRRNTAAQSHHMRSKRGLALKDHDSRFKKNAARITNKDGTGGKLLNQLGGRLKQAGEELDKLKVKKRYDMGIWVPGEKSKKDYLFHIKADIIDFGENGSLSFPDLVMYPDDKIALTGSNGAGKSSLISHILNLLHIDPNRLVYIPQEIDRESSGEIIADAKRLSGEKLGEMMAIVSHLGSRPERLLESYELSPGETRKVLLATGITKAPHLIIMDEPTNHMDLPSIECLEAALSDCPCGMLLVSHDRMFLDKLTDRNWHISRHGGIGSRYILQEVF